MIHFNQFVTDSGLMKKKEIHFLKTCQQKSCTECYNWLIWQEERDLLLPQVKRWTAWIIFYKMLTNLTHKSFYCLSNKLIWVNWQFFVSKLRNRVLFSVIWIDLTMSIHQIWILYCFFICIAYSLSLFWFEISNYTVHLFRTFSWEKHLIQEMNIKIWDVISYEKETVKIKWHQNIYAISDKANNVWWKPIMCPSSIKKRNKLEIS